MCGIFGIWNRDGRPLDLAAVERGVESLRHRGPDDEGYLLVDTRRGEAIACGGADTVESLGLPSIEEFRGRQFNLALGFRRLAILDVTPAGHQPMPSRDGRLWIVFNGEIYNYLELRSELEGLGYAFRTNTDTEVILAAYDRWGAECLGRFNGMWGLAIWDNLRRSLFVARDRFGVKPCYLADGPGGSLAFASEIKALRASGTAGCEPSPAALGGFVAFGAFPSHRAGATFFRDVRSLPPGHASLFEQNDEQTSAYWQLPAAEEQPLDEAASGARFRELLVDSIRLRLRSDVPLGTCLSGGLDSSAIVAIVRQLTSSPMSAAPSSVGPRQHTFSAVYDSEGEWNERVHVDRVLARTGAQGHFVVPKSDGLWDEIQQVLAYQDEPVQSSAIYAQWCVMRLARRRGVTVLLDGQGADELLGGYRPYQAVVQDLLRRCRFWGAWRAASDIGRTAGLGRTSLLSAAAKSELGWRVKRWLRPSGSGRWALETLAGAGLNEACLAEHADEIARAAAGAAAVQHASLDEQLRYQMLEESLPNLLRYEDRNSMAFSIEARVPFLDYRLAEFVFRSAAPWRFRRGWTKWLLRRSIENDLPEEIVWRRDKVGYDVPEIDWLRDRRAEVVELFSDASPLAAYFDVPGLRNTTRELLSRGTKRDGRRVWRWINAALWMRSLADASAARSPSANRPSQRSADRKTAESVS